MDTLSKLVQAKQLDALIQPLRLLGNPPWSLCLVAQDGAILSSAPSHFVPRDLPAIWAQLAEQDSCTMNHQVGIRLPLDQGDLAMVARIPGQDAANGLSQLQAAAQILAYEINMQAETHALAQELIHRYDEINLLYNMGETIASNLDLTQVCNLVLQETGRIIQTAQGAIILWDTDRFVIKTSYGLQAHDKAVFLRVAEQALFSGKPEVLEPNQITTNLTTSLLCAPLKTKTKVLGALLLGGKKDGEPFTASDTKLLLALTHQTATAIESAQLYTVTDQALTTQLGELYILQEIDRQLNATLNVTQIIDLSLEWALRSTQAIAGLIALIDPHQGNRVLSAQGYPQKLTRSGLPGNWFGQALITQMLERQKPVTVLDTHAEAGYVPLSPGIRSQLAVPLHRENKVTGVICLESSQPNMFTQDDIDFIVRLADHTTVAIENAHLFEQVRQANEAKSEFVSTVAHELKVPMTAIKGFVNLLRRDPHLTLPPTHLRYLEIIDSNVNHMNALISDLLDIAHLEAGTVELQIRPTDLRAMIDDICNTMSDWAQRKNHVLTQHLPSEVPPVLGDPSRLEQILTNLLSNAIKYTPPHGQICITIKVDKATDKVWVQVSDTGIGISAQDQAKLFSKFFRSDHPAVRDQEGNGLGLSIVKRLVEAHHSEIMVDSEPNHGTTFSFWLPIATT